MKERPREIAEEIRNRREDRKAPAVSAVFPDGTIVETCYRTDERRTAFLVAQGEALTFADSVTTPEGETLVPFSPRNNLLVNEVVLFPSEAEEFGTDGELVAEIQAFIHRYVHVSPLFEKIASYY